MSVADWDLRQLCPDGTCIGVIGPDGTCKTCGRVAPNWGDYRTRGLIPVEDEDPDEDEDDEIDDEGEDHDEDDDEDAVAAQAAGADAEPVPAPHAGAWDDRALCPDGACVGVIGANGRCKACGRSARGEAAAPAAAPGPCLAPGCAGTLDADGTCTTCGAVVS
jgi:hypothetical protein